MLELQLKVTKTKQSILLSHQSSNLFQKNSFQPINFTDLKGRKPPMIQCMNPDPYHGTDGISLAIFLVWTWSVKGFVCLFVCLGFFSINTNSTLSKIFFSNNHLPLTWMVEIPQWYNVWIQTYPMVLMGSLLQCFWFGMGRQRNQPYL